MHLGRMTPDDAPHILLLDVMSTLVYDPYVRELPDFFGRDLAELMRLKHPTAWVDFERNVIDEETFAEIFLPGISFDYDALKSTLRDAYRFLDGIEPLLEELQAAGVEMHALSNYPVWWKLIEEKLGLSRFMSWDFVSCRTGHRKPEPDAYRVVTTSLEQAPEACLFVDDRERNCEGARAVGMFALRFEDSDQLRAELIERGFIDS